MNGPWLTNNNINVNSQYYINDRKKEWMKEWNNILSSSFLSLSIKICQSIRDLFTFPWINGNYK